jgi:hypothetical protein
LRSKSEKRGWAQAIPNRPNVHQVIPISADQRLALADRQSQISLGNTFSIGLIAPDFLTIIQIGDRRVLIANF